MRVEIESTGNNPSNTLLNVYEIHNKQMKTSGLRPICSIYEEDFYELLTDNQIAKLESGTTIFEVNKDELINKSKTKF